MADNSFATLENRKNIFLKKLEEINGEVFEMVGEFKNTNEETLFKCKKCDNLFLSSPYNIVRRKRNGCNICLKKKKKSKTKPELTIKNIKLRKEKFIEKLNAKYKNKEFEYLSGFIDLKTQCKFKCNNCGNSNYWITPDYIIKKSNINCNKCSSPHNKQDLNSYIEDIKSKYGERFNIEIDKNKNFENSKSKVHINCNNCDHDFKATADRFKLGGICPYCNMTTLEKEAYEILLKYFSKEEIEIQKGFDNLVFKNAQKFDFYIEKENLLIEVDGKQHINDKSFGDEKESEISFLRDQNKNKFVLDNNLKLIRILYNQGIETVLMCYFDHGILTRNIFSINI
ncbi:homing endonuclease [Staphylococcus phage Madawaska]|nr:homing endonuclease [Staphylococcus phage Madawaska]